MYLRVNKIHKTVVVEVQLQLILLLLLPDQSSRSVVVEAIDVTVSII